VLVGVGVLLLAMGVGVLIGRVGSSKQSALAPQVITVAATPSGTAGASTPSTSEASFSDDWPSARSGYTVELQTLPQSGTSVITVQAAKAAASAKGAKAVGALKSEDFTSLSAGSYVIYSGVYHERSEAAKALPALRKSFPGAKVVGVTNGGSTASAAGSGAASGTGSSERHPAPPTVLNKLKGVKGKSYEEKSKELPNVVETG